jgi:hypothetical protein
VINRKELKEFISRFVDLECIYIREPRFRTVICGQKNDDGKFYYCSYHGDNFSDKGLIRTDSKNGKKVEGCFYCRYRVHKITLQDILDKPKQSCYTCKYSEPNYDSDPDKFYDCKINNELKGGLRVVCCDWKFKNEEYRPYADEVVSVDYEEDILKDK